MFIKLFYGFGVPDLPVITFSMRAAAEKMIREAEPGDVLLFAATKSSKTRDPNERGRLLGAAQFGSDIVPVEKLVDPELLRSEFMENGRYRWPEALPILRAWQFDPAPKTQDVIRDRMIERNAAAYALRVSEADELRVRSLNWVEVKLKQTEEHQRQIVKAKQLLRGRSKPGPIQGAGSHNVTRIEKFEAWTYAARFGDTPIWKIGHSSDIGSRLLQLNAHVPFEWLQQEWQIFLQQGWQGQSDAQKMEQAVLDALACHPIERERVKCTPDQLTSAWITALRKTREAGPDQ